MKILFNPLSGKFDYSENKASGIDITDIGSYFSGEDVETALQEIGDGTTLDTRYVNSAGDDAITGNLIPATDSDIDLGSSTKYWANAYVDKVYLKSNTHYIGVDGNDIEISAGGIAGYKIELHAPDFYHLGAYGSSRWACLSSVYRWNPPRITEINQTFRPQADSAKDLGDTAHYWRNIYADKVYLNANANLDGASDGYLDYNATIAHRFDAPLTLAEKALLETPVAGTLEYNGKFYITNEAGQKVIDRTSDVALETVTVTNTTVETTLWAAEMAANSLEVGNVFRFLADGVVSSASASDTVTVRVKVGGDVKMTLVSEAKQLNDDHWHLEANATQRTLGVSGSRAMHMDLVVGDYSTETIAIGTVDTTANMDVIITAQWNNAKAGNTISLYQGFMGYRN